MALYGDLTYDSRVRREAATLADAGYDVSVVCLASVQSNDLPENVRVIVRQPTATSVLPGTPERSALPSGGRLVRLGRRMEWLRGYTANLRSWGRQAARACGPVDIWHAHDLPGLAAVAPVAGALVPVVYDSHELFVDAGTARLLPGPARMLLRAYERHLVSGVAAVLTVNEALAGVIRRRYRPRRIEVLHNCPDRWALPTEDPGLLRRAANIPTDAQVILYHGGLGPDRGIEQLIEALGRPGLERAQLVLLGSGEKRDIFAAIAREPRLAGRLHVLDPVPPAELLSWVVSADVGGVLIQKSTLNHYLSTPNKLFECLAAGVPVIASDFPMMRRVVVDDPRGPLGAVCDPSRVDDVAAELRLILGLDAVATRSLRARCADAAQNRWNWQVESLALTRLYEDLLLEAR